MEKEEWVSYAQMSSYKIFQWGAVSNLNILESSCIESDNFVQF